jgi:hypothetical protein
MLPEEMKKTAALIVLVLMPLLALPAMAGVGPSPFTPQIGKLNSFANSLSSVSQRLNAAFTRMGIEPSPFRPVVNQWEAEANKLEVLQGRLELIVSVPEVQAMNSDVVLDPELSAALERVRDAANSVVFAAEQWRGEGPAGANGSLPQDLVPVLEGAQAMADSVNDIIKGS